MTSCKPFTPAQEHVHRAAGPFSHHARLGNSEVSEAFSTGMLPLTPDVRAISESGCREKEAYFWFTPEYGGSSYVNQAQDFLSHQLVMGAPWRHEVVGAHCAATGGDQGHVCAP